MKQALQETKFNALLAQQGYVVFNFLSPEQVEILSSFYESNPNPIKGSFHTTHFNTNTDYKRKVQSFILHTLAENFKKHFTEYTPVFANFMIKEGGGNNPMPLHADWTYVEESKSSSYAIWIPLVNTDVVNGCIGVIPFSHHLSHNIRGPRILQWEPPANDLLINKMGKLLPMKIGEVLIYNHRTLHYSPPNNSEVMRPAINVSLAPMGEEIIHYTIPEGENALLKFAVSGDDFFLDYHNFQMPRHGKLLQQILLPVPLINMQVEKFILLHTSKSIFSFFKKKSRCADS